MTLQPSTKQNFYQQATSLLTPNSGVSWITVNVDLPPSTLTSVTDLYLNLYSTILSHNNISPNAGGGISAIIAGDFELSIQDCIFYNLSAVEGGAISVKYGNLPSLSFAKTIFLKNFASNGGGAIDTGLISQIYEATESTVYSSSSYCIFVECSSDAMGGAYSASDENMNLVFSESVFVGNKADMGGVAY